MTDSELEPSLNLDAPIPYAGNGPQYVVNTEPMSLSKLRALAEEARQGPWRVYETVQADTFVLVGSRGLLLDDVICVPTYEQRNARYIAAASPDIILALIDLVEARND